MKNRNFISYKSYGNIDFGEHYVDVRKKLNSPYEQVYFDSDSKNFSDHFDELGFKVEYDTNNNVLSIETWNYTNNPFLFLDKDIASLTFKELETLLKENDSTTEQFSIGFYSPKYGISICSESFEPDEPSTSFHIIRKDYMEINKANL